MGCSITEKRITCCCNHKDYCNDYPDYAVLGRPENYGTQPEPQDIPYVSQESAANIEQIKEDKGGSMLYC